MASSTPDNRILPLSSLRFLLAVWIFVHHLYPVWWMPLSRRLGEFVTGLFVAGFVAVPFFFMLSGFVLAFAYGSTTRMNKPERLRFWLRRFSRLAPAFYLALFIGIFPYLGMVLKHVDASMEVLIGTARDLLTNMLFLGAASQRALIMNNSSWTISVEAVFYSVFPFFCPVVFRLQRKSIFTLLVACVAACVAMQLTVMHFHPVLYDWRASQFRPPYYFGESQEKWRFYVLVNPLFHFPEFLMGVALARLNALSSGIKRRADLPVALCAALLVATLCVLPRLPYLFLYNWILLPPMALTIYVLANGRGRVIDFLSHPKLLLYGEASYVLYILHTPARDWLSFTIGHFGLRHTYFQYLIGAAFVPIFIAASIPLHYHVNVPITRALYSYLKSRFLTPSAMPEAQEPLVAAEKQSA